MTDDDRRGPPPRAGTLPDRDVRTDKRRTPVGGVPIVPVDFDQPITGVHKAPELELLARATRTQHVTEGVAASTLSINSRLVAVESDVAAVKADVGAVKGSVALVQKSLDAQDKYLKPMVDVFAGRVTMDYTRERAHLETGAAQKTSEIKALDLKRDRSTATYKTVLAWVTPIVTAVIAFGAARC